MIDQVSLNIRSIASPRALNQIKKVFYFTPKRKIGTKAELLIISTIKSFTSMSPVSSNQGRLHVILRSHFLFAHYFLLQLLH